MKLTKKLKQAILNWAKECYPAEACGVIVAGEFIPCANVSTDKNQFEIDPKDLARAEDKGEIQAYVHSHPDGTAYASQADLVQLEHHDKAWVICGYPEGDFKVYLPTGYKAPLIGRDYYHGLLDCYTIVKDFYSRELGIVLPDFERKDRWWEDKSHSSLYLENYEKAGGVEVDIDTLQYGDVLLCRVGRTEHVNHAVIWLGDNAELKSEKTEPCVGSSLILHHPYGRKSCREIYGKQWQEQTVKVVRYVKKD